MTALAPFGLIAMLPAALGVTAAGGAALMVRVCTGDAPLRMVEMPLNQPGSLPAPCCTKGCHSRSARDKAGKKSGSRQ